MVTTDLFGRGIDVERVNIVINYGALLALMEMYASVYEVVRAC